MAEIPAPMARIRGGAGEIVEFRLHDKNAPSGDLAWRLRQPSALAVLLPIHRALMPLEYMKQHGGRLLTRSSDTSNNMRVPIDRLIPR